MAALGRKGGYSLVEVLVAIAIIGVLAAIAAPTLLSSTLPGMQLRSTSLDIYSTLQAARGRAVGSTTRFGVRFDLGASPQTYTLVQWDSGTGAWVQPAEGAIVRQVTSTVVVNDVTVDGSTFASGVANVILFNSVGTSSAAVIRLRGASNPAQRYNVTVNATTGRVRIATGW